MVHAPGGALTARVPGPAGRRQHPRRHQAAGARGGDHAAARAALRGGRGHPLQRHRRARPRRRLRRRRRSRHRARWSPSRSAPKPTSPACGRSNRTTDAPYVGETVRLLVKELDVPLIGFAGAPFTVASLPDRGRSVPHVRPDEGADVRRREPVAPAPRPTGRHHDRLAAAPDRERGAGVPAVRLVGRGARSGRLRALRAAPTASGSSPPWPTPTCPASTSASTPASCSAPSPRPGPTWSGSTGARRSTSPAPGSTPRSAGRWPSRATSTPRLVLGPWPARRGHGATRCSTANAGRPGHVFNLGSRRAPRDRPGRAGADRRTSSTRPPARRLTMADRVGVLVMAYGTPRRPDEIEAYYTDIRRGRPPTAGAAGGPQTPLRGDRRPVAARRAHRGAAGRAGRRPRRACAGALRGGARPEARPPDHRGGRPRAGGPGRAAGSWARARAALLGPVGRPVPRAGHGGRGRGGHPASPAFEHWHLEPAYLDFLSRAVRAGLAALPAGSPRWCSPPTASRPASWPRATPTRTSCGPPPQAVAERAELGPAMERRLAVGGTHARAVARPGRPRR